MIPRKALNLYGIVFQFFVKCRAGNTKKGGSSSLVSLHLRQGLEDQLFLFLLDLFLKDFRWRRWTRWERAFELCRQAAHGKLFPFPLLQARLFENVYELSYVSRPVIVHQREKGLVG